MSTVHRQKWTPQEEILIKGGHTVADSATGNSEITSRQVKSKMI